MVNGKQVWSNVRLGVLVLTFASTVIVLGKNLLHPSSDSVPVPPLVLPNQIPLTNWQFRSTQPQTPPASNPTLTWHHQQIYQYQQAQDSLTVTLYDLSGHGAVGDIEQVLKQITKDRPRLSIHQDSQYGSYALFSQQHQHLLTCLTPNGRSTVNTTEFRQNRLQAALNRKALQDWFWGHRTFLDKRCLWTHMVLQEVAPNGQGPSRLEQAWRTWAQWWQPHLPNR